MSWQKYILAFVITAAIFGTAFYIASRFNTQRVADIQSAEDALSTDLLSSEVQFELLGNTADCATLSQSPVLADQLNSLAARLSVAESNLGSTNPQVIQLKKQYSLLEIKDYLLLQQIAKECQKKPVYILYFYSNAGDCQDCARSGDVLTYLREQYPELRVYSFDFNLDLSALRTLETIQGVQGGQLPAFVINGRKPVYGFKTFEEIQALIPELKTMATSTGATTGGY
jgi:hypothetical protein